MGLFFVIAVLVCGSERFYKLEDASGVERCLLLHVPGLCSVRRLIDVFLWPSWVLIYITSRWYV